MTARVYTPAQRRALMALTGEWKSNPAGASSHACHSLVHGHKALCERALGRNYLRTHYVWRLTPAGMTEKERIGTNDRG